MFVATHRVMSLVQAAAVRLSCVSYDLAHKRTVYLRPLSVLLDNAGAQIIPSVAWDVLNFR